MHQFTLPEFLIAFAALTIVWGGLVLLHKRGLKNDKKKLDKKYPPELEVKMDMDYENEFWPDRNIV